MHARAMVMVVVWRSLENGTTFPVASESSAAGTTGVSDEQGRAGRDFEDAVDVVARQRGTFDVTFCADLSGDAFCLPGLAMQFNRGIVEVQGAFWGGGRGTAVRSTKRRDIRLMSSIASRSSRRSLFRPTRTMGVPGQ
jgi:hypothetical protein